MERLGSVSDLGSFHLHFPSDLRQYRGFEYHQYLVSSKFLSVALTFLLNSGILYITSCCHLLGVYNIVSKVTMSFCIHSHVSNQQFHLSSNTDPHRGKCYLGVVVYASITFIYHLQTANQFCFKINSESGYFSHHLWYYILIRALSSFSALLLQFITSLLGTTPAPKTAVRTVLLHYCLGHARPLL